MDLLLSLSFFIYYIILYGVEHMSLLNEIKIYEKSLTPKFCEITLKKINSFNDKCNPILEILDYD